MLDKVFAYIDIVTRHAGQLDRIHWVIISVVVLGLGVVCMRGFGSQQSY